MSSHTHAPTQIPSNRIPKTAPLKDRIGLRRSIFLVLVAASIVGLLYLMFATLAPGGLTWLDWAMIIPFAITLPWTAIGFWNALIGLWLMRSKHDPAGYVFPALRAVDDDVPLTTSTALLSCIRNEDVEPLARKLSEMLSALVTHGVNDRFHLYVLSDTDDSEIAEAEEALVDGLTRRFNGKVPITYRRRTDNPGFKAGNIRDFCERWGASHDFMITLDADSFMTAPAITRLVRLMESRSELGIVQSLVVGLPSASAFCRLFQYGMRLGMQSYTTGSAWWQGDCGPYWGHNAIIRMKPFIEACELPKLPGNGPLGGWVLSHDQVEAALMRRAGYEVRVIAEDTGSFEENPPDLLEFIRRDLRWCHGNMQYAKLLNAPGLHPMSRVQLVLAILMFVGSPAWLAFMSIATARFMSADDVNAIVDPQMGAAVFATIMTMVFAPKIATVLAALFDAERRRQFGGGIRLVGSAVSEMVFAAFIAPIMAVSHTVFLAGLPFGRAKAWPSQRRDVHGLPVGVTVRRLIMPTVFGLIGLACALAVPPAAALAMVPVFLGPLLAAPFALLSAGLNTGQLAASSSLWRLPEETDPPVELLRLDLPGLTAIGHAPHDFSGPALSEDRQIVPAE
ncbi:MAG: glucans biosynthesis glucosyltransferase MdoH [Pseudomonadota bacterium]